MTQREFFNAIVTGTVTLNAGKETETSYSAYADGVLIPEIVEFAEKAIEKLNAKNLAAKGKPRAKKANPENEGYKEQIKANCTVGTVYTTKAITEILNDLNPDFAEPITTQKASALIRQLRDEGFFNEKETKKGKTKEYTVAESVDEVAE